jgi:hypothetical protein
LIWFWRFFSVGDSFCVVAPAGAAAISAMLARIAGAARHISLPSVVLG